MLECDVMRTAYESNLRKQRPHSDATMAPLQGPPLH